ncbi:MAG TPA: hypothetical protein VF457_05550 [Burkholderiaceae bacterium]
MVEIDFPGIVKDIGPPDSTTGAVSLDVRLAVHGKPEAVATVSVPAPLWAGMRTALDAGDHCMLRVRGRLTDTTPAEVVTIRRIRQAAPAPTLQ